MSFFVFQTESDETDQSGRMAYIGLTDDITENDFYWMDGNPSSFRNWNPGTQLVHIHTKKLSFFIIQSC